MVEKSFGIIPARYGSTRLPGKPLMEIGNKPIIQHVYERASASLSNRVAVATDDDRIVEAVESFGGLVVRTSTEHKSGTDRIAEALQLIGVQAEVILNIQGDEPFVSTEQIQGVLEAFNDQRTDIATTVIPLLSSNATLDDLHNPNIVKAVRAWNGRILYFSRQSIPFGRDIPQEQWLSKKHFFRHLGMYGYRADVLRQITALPESPLERFERLEQLRWLEAGYTIQGVLSDRPTIGIDTIDDLEKARQYYENEVKVND